MALAKIRDRQHPMKHALLIIDVQQALCSGAEAAFDIDRVVDQINSCPLRQEWPERRCFSYSTRKPRDLFRIRHRRLATLRAPCCATRGHSRSQGHSTRQNPSRCCKPGTSRSLPSAPYRVTSAWTGPSAERWRWATQSCSYRSHIRLWTTAFPPRRRSRRIITRRWRTLEALVRDLH